MYIKKEKNNNKVVRVSDAERPQQSVMCCHIALGIFLALYEGIC